MGIDRDPKISNDVFLLKIMKLKVRRRPRMFLQTQMRGSDLERRHACAVEMAIMIEISMVMNNS